VKYRTIVADPPWDVGRGPEWASNGASRPLTYPTMDVDAIAALPVADLAEKRAHLYVWTINAYVEDTYDIVRHWGFRPSTLLTWCKAPNGIGLGGTYSLTTEHVLFARRGVLPAERRIDTTWFQMPRGAHSAKPEAFLDLVESVSPGPYLEMFARRQRLGWDTWGNEALDHLDEWGELQRNSWEVAAVNGPTTLTHKENA
jgi:N6-adenosine-specific RNA methylase IME4